MSLSAIHLLNCWSWTLEDEITVGSPGVPDEDLIVIDSHPLTAGGFASACVALRPGAVDLLRELHETCEVALFTASPRKVAELGASHPALHTQAPPRRPSGALRGAPERRMSKWRSVFDPFS